jgi:hypothetical protein
MRSGRSGALVADIPANTGVSTSAIERSGRARRSFLFLGFFFLLAFLKFPLFLFCLFSGFSPFLLALWLFRPFLGLVFVVCLVEFFEESPEDSALRFGGCRAGFAAGAPGQDWHDEQGEKRERT